jgi:hypothetical protein
LNQTSITCPAGRTLLDGVCVRENVADYVACVRAQGAQLGGSKQQQLSADVGTVGVRAGGSAEVKESLEKKYAGWNDIRCAHELRPSFVCESL